MKCKTKGCKRPASVKGSCPQCLALRQAQQVERRRASEQMRVALEQMKAQVEWMKRKSLIPEGEEE